MDKCERIREKHRCVFMQQIEESHYVEAKGQPGYCSSKTFFGYNKLKHASLFEYFS